MRLTRRRQEPPQERNGNGALERPCSVLGRGLMASGRLESDGEVHIHGTVKGDVHASKVVLCTDGFVEGNLIAREAVLEGRIKGRVFAFNVMVEGTAVIRGNVFHHELTVAAGAHLEGRTPWRPVNYFDDISHQFDDISHHFHGDIDEYVHAR